MLLFGGTGVGKSTFINSFINYVKFSSLKDAIDGELECPIPVNFKTYKIDKNGEYIEKDVQFGTSTYEGTETHMTAT